MPRCNRLFLQGIGAVFFGRNEKMLNNLFRIAKKDMLGNLPIKCLNVKFSLKLLGTYGILMIAFYKAIFYSTRVRTLGEVSR